MNISLKKLFVLPALVLAVCLSLLALPGTAMADTEMGECGSVTWELDTRAGELLISGGTLDDDLSGWVPEYLRFYVGVVVFDGDVVAGTSLSDEDDSGMFNSFSSLTSLDLSKLNTSNVTNMQYLFDGCSNLTSLDVSGLDTSNVTSMMGMFNGCSSLTSLDLSKLDTSKVTNFARLFYGCSGLTSIDVSSIDTSNFIFGTQDLLTGCSSLNTITFGAKFKFAGGGPGVPTPTSTASGGTSTGKWGKGSEFADTTYTASELQTYGATAGNLAGTWYAQGTAATITYKANGATGDDVTETVAQGAKATLKSDGFTRDGYTLTGWNTAADGTGTGYTLGQADVAVSDNLTLYAQWDSTTESGTCGTVKWILHKDTGVLEVFGGTLDDLLIGWLPSSYDSDSRSKVKSVVFNDTVTAGRSLCSYDVAIFEGFTNLTSIDLSKLDTSNVVNINFMFCDCSSLTSLDLSPLNTSKVEYTCDVFMGCTSLNTITFGDSFKFIDDSSIPAPTKTASGATSTGKWGKGSEVADTTYTASELQTYGSTAGNLTGTWYAQAETVTVTYTIAGTTDTFEETVAKGSEYTLKTHIDGFVKSGCELSSWYNRDAGGYAPGSTITVDKDMRFTATWNMLTEYERVEPTCTTAGTEAYWYSVNSKKYYSDDLAQKQIDGPVSIPALGHDAVHHGAKEPTCTEDGNNEYWSCSRCSKYFSDAACTTETTADAVKIAAKGHTLTKTEAVAPTCTEDGHEAYWTCSNCNKIFSDEDGTTEISQPETISATGHKWDAGVVTKEPTATEKGVKTYTCTACGDTKTEEIPATGSSDKGDGDKGGTTTTVTKTTTTTKAAAGDNVTPKTGDTADFAVVLFSVLATLALVSGRVAQKKR